MYLVLFKPPTHMARWGVIVRPSVEIELQLDDGTPQAIALLLCDIGNIAPDPVFNSHDSLLAVGQLNYGFRKSKCAEEDATRCAPAALSG
jgi:hypothetical protein